MDHEGILAIVRENSFGVFSVTELVVEGGNSLIREVISDEGRLLSFDGLSHVKKVSDEVRAVIERTSSTPVFLTPVGIEVEEPTLPSIKEPAFSGVPNVGKCRAVAHCDRCRNDFHHTVFSPNVTTTIGTVFGRFGGFAMIGKDCWIQSRIGNVGPQNDGAIFLPKRSGIEGERIS